MELKDEVQEMPKTLNEVVDGYDSDDIGAMLHVWIDDQHPELIDEFAEYVSIRFNADDDEMDDFMEPVKNG